MNKIDKILVVLLTFFAVIITIYFHSIGINVIFAHIYYIPVVYIYYVPVFLAIIIWGWKGWLLSIGFAIFHIISHILQMNTPPWSDLVRASMLIMVTGSIAWWHRRTKIAEEKERLRYEETLRQERDFSQEIIQTADALIVGLDLEGRITLFNRKCVEVTGYTEGEAISRHIWDFLLPERFFEPVGEAFRGLRNGVEQGEWPTYYENPWLTKSGEERWIAWHNTALRDTEGQIINIIGIGIDITKRKRAEEALLKEKEKFQSLSEKSPFGISIIDRDGRYEYINPEFIKIFGYMLEDIPTGKDWFEKAYPDPKYRGEAISTWIKDLKAAERGEARPRIFTVTCKDGSAKEISFRPASIYEEKQFVTYEDITERKRAEEEILYRLKLESAIARISALLMSADDLDVALNIALGELGNTVDVNRACIFMLKDDGAKMDNTHEWCADGTEPQIENLQDLDTAIFPWGMTKLYQNENIIVSDVSKLPPEARAEKEILEARKIYSLLIVPMYSRDRLLGFIGFDDTEKTRHWRDENVNILHLASDTLVAFMARNQAEEELKRRKEELEELTVQLNEALRVKSKFLNMVSHELRTPLTGIRGAAEIIYSMPDLSRDQLEEMSDIIIKNVDRQEILTNDLLTLARLEVGRQEVNLQAIPLAQVVLDIIHSHTTAAENKGVKISSFISSGIPEIMLDRNVIVTTLTNLIGNALKFTEPGGEISISAKLEDEKVVLNVSDTGIGIPEDKLDHIFDRFYQVDMSTTRRYGGTGLGLSIVKEMVELLEGDIKVESKIGKGTTFTIRLPYLPAEESVISSSLSTPGEELKFNDKTVLIVDDEPDTVRILGVIMNRLGYETLTALDGKQAMEILKRHPSVDLMLLDLRLPVKDGYEVIEEIRKDGRFKDLPIIIVSAEGREWEIERAMDLGANGHIMKPFKLEELSDIAGKMLD